MASRRGEAVEERPGAQPAPATAEAAGPRRRRAEDEALITIPDLGPEGRVSKKRYAVRHGMSAMPSS